PTCPCSGPTAGTSAFSRLFCTPCCTGSRCSLDGPKDATIVLRGLLGAGFVVAVLSLLQVAFGSLNAPGAAETGFSFGGVLRGYGTFGNPNALGAFLAMLLPVAVWEFLAARSAFARWLSANVTLVLALG